MKINPRFVRLAACVMALSQSAGFAQNAPSPPTYPTPETDTSPPAQGVGTTPSQGEATSGSVTATPTPLFNGAPANQEVPMPVGETGARPLLTGPLSLQKAVEVALANSPRLRGAQADVDIAIAQLRAARAARKPSVSATTFLTGGSENGPIYNSPDGVTPQNLFAVPHGAFANQNVMFMLPLFNGGRLGAVTRQAQATRGAFEADLQTARLDVALETKTAYRQALLALELQNVAASRQTATGERLKNDQAALEAGRVPQLYVLRDQAEDADAGQENINAARDVELSLVMLRAVMGIQSESAITLSDSLDTTAADSSDANPVQKALSSRPELQAARARLESARRGGEAARGNSKFQAALMGMADANRGRAGNSTRRSVRRWKRPCPQLKTPIKNSPFREKRAVFVSAFERRQHAEIALDVFLNLVTNTPGAFKFFVGRARQSRGIGKPHVQPFGFAGEHRAALGAGFIAHRHGIVEGLPARQNIGDRLRLMARHVYADFGHRLRDNRIETPRLNARTLRLETVAAQLIDERFGHHRARRIVDAHKQDFFFSHFSSVGVVIRPGIIARRTRARFDL